MVTNGVTLTILELKSVGTGEDASCLIIGKRWKIMAKST